MPGDKRLAGTAHEPGAWCVKWETRERWVSTKTVAF